MRKECSEIDELRLELEKIINLTSNKKKKGREKKKNIVPRESAFANIPKGVIYDILVQIPPSCVHANIRLVCKLWRDITSTRDFISRNMRIEKPQLLIQRKASYRRRFFKLKSLEVDQDQLHCELRDFSVGCAGWIRGSSCNGFLLACYLKNRTFRVINPVTKCFVDIPKCLSGCPHDESCGLALAYDSNSDNLKVVHVYNDSFGFEIFTVGCGDNSWRKIPGPEEHGVVRPFDMDFKWEDPVKINERLLYWDVGSRRFITVMDMNDESFKTVYLPRIEKMSHRLIELCGRLSVVCGITSNVSEVWVLEDFEGRVWSKKHVISEDTISYPINNDDRVSSSKNVKALAKLNKLEPLGSTENGDRSSSRKYVNVIPKLDKLKAVGSTASGEVLVFEHDIYDTFYFYWTRRKEMTKLQVTYNHASPSVITYRSSLLRLKTPTEL